MHLKYPCLATQPNHAQTIPIYLSALAGCGSFQEAEKTASPTRGLANCSEKCSVSRKTVPHKHINDTWSSLLSLDVMWSSLKWQRPEHAPLPSLHPSLPPPAPIHPPCPQNEKNVIHTESFSAILLSIPQQFHFNIDQIRDDNWWAMQVMEEWREQCWAELPAPMVGSSSEPQLNPFGISKGGKK